MGQVPKVWLGFVFAGALVVGWCVWTSAQPPAAPKGEGGDFPQELQEQAKRLGVEPKDLVKEQMKFQMEMERERVKQPPTLLAHGDSLYVVRGAWLLQFDLQNLQLKNMQNMDLLAEQFHRKMREQKEQQREKGGEREKQEKPDQ